MRTLKAWFHRKAYSAIKSVANILTPFFIANLLNEAQWHKATPLTGSTAVPLPTQSDSRQVRRAKIRTLAFIAATNQLGLTVTRQSRRELARKAQYLARATGANAA